VTFSEITKKLSDGGIDSPAFEATELILRFESVSRAMVRFGDYLSPKLSEAIAGENFEEAAILRDKIRSIEKEDKK